MKSPPTLKDLAEELGLSVATVSLALRGLGNLSEATRERVREAARRIGYRPNTHAVALSAREQTVRQHDIPLAVLRRRPAPTAEWYPIDFFVKGIRKRASELGYRVEVFPHESGMSLESLLRILFNRGFQGLFLAPVGEFAPPLKEWRHFSVLSCGRFDRASPFHTVRHEIFESTLSALERLRDQGCQRIGLSLFRHDPPITDDKQRVAAALVAQKTFKCKVTHFFYRTSEEMVSMVCRKRLDGLVAFSFAEYFHLVAAGIQIPGEMKLVALHLCDDPSNRCIPGFLPAEYDCGIAAANRMDAMIRHHERGIPEFSEQVVIPPRWRDALEEP